MSHDADAAARPAVLMLHGQPGGARDWDRVIEALGQGVCTIAIDRPGWDGQSEAADLDGNAAAAIAALDAHDVRRATVVGHSLGGAVAAWLAIQSPDRVAALVLAAPAAGREAIGRLDGVLAAPLVGSLSSAAALSAAGLALGAPALRGLLARTLGLEAEYVDRAARLLLTPATWRSFVFEQQMLVRELPWLECRLGEISVPAAIVCGTADRIVPPAAARALSQRMACAKLVCLPGAGHLLPQRHAERLSALILDTIETI